MNFRVIGTLITEDSVHLQYNVNAVYPKICFRKRTKCSAWKNTKFSLGRIQTPYCYIRNHLSSLHTQCSMVPFCRPPPSPDGQILKKDPEFIWKVSFPFYFTANRAVKRLNVPRPIMPKIKSRAPMMNKVNTAPVQRANVPKQNAKRNFIYGKIMPRP